jgi:peroxiredoxin
MKAYTDHRTKICMHLSLFAAGVVTLLALTAFGAGKPTTEKAAEPAVAEPVQTASVGKPAPNFILPDSDGVSHTLSSLKGKTVVLEWFNDKCPFVGKHYNSGNMQKLQKTYTGKGVVWFSICSSAPGKEGYCTPEEMKQVREERKSNSTATLLDPAGDVGRLYGARTTPHMFVIDPKGTLAYDGAIDSIRSTDPEDVAKAEPYFAEALDEVLAGKPVTRPATTPYGCSVKYAK